MFTRYLNRPEGQPITYYDDRKICLYVYTTGDGKRQCPSTEPKLPDSLTRVHFRFHSLTGDKPSREVPVSFENHGRTYQLQNVAVSTDTNCHVANYVLKWQSMDQHECWYLDDLAPPVERVGGDKVLCHENRIISAWYMVVLMTRVTKTGA